MKMCSNSECNLNMVEIEDDYNVCPICGSELIILKNCDNYSKLDINNEDFSYINNYGTSISVSFIDPQEKKEKIFKIVFKYAEAIGKECVAYKLWKYDNYPTEKKDLLIKFDSNSNYDDFACMFAIPNPMKLQLSPKGDYGIVFTLFGFYITDSLFRNYFIKYNEITNCIVTTKRDIRICVNHVISNFLVDDDYINNGEYLAQPLADLLMELKSIDSEFPTDHLMPVTSNRTKGIHSSRDRKYFMKGQINGYYRCSREYEKKLRRQAELFLKVANKWKQERAAYEALLDEYDATIVELEGKLREAESPEYRERLNNVSEYREKLASLSY